MIGPIIAFIFAVVISEAMQLCVWKANNLDKPWGLWFRWGIPHFGTNLGIILAIATLWLAGYLDEVLDWIAHLPSMVLPVSLPTEITFDKLLPVNYPVGVILGLGTDLLGDKIGFLVKVVLEKFTLSKGDSSVKEEGK